MKTEKEITNEIDTETENKEEIKFVFDGENDSVQRLPVIPMRDVVLFPDMLIHFEAKQDKTINALKESSIEKGDNLLFITYQKNYEVDEPSSISDVCKIGVIAKIKQTIRISSSLGVVVEGICRARAENFDFDGEYISADVTKKPEILDAGFTEEHKIAVMRACLDAFEKYSASLPAPIASEILERAEHADTPKKLYDVISGNMTVIADDRQALLEENTYELRLTSLLEILVKETDIMILERKIAERVKSRIDNSQREFYLREQMRAIREQLEGSSQEYFDDVDFMEEDPSVSDDDYEQKIKKLGLESVYEKKLLKENERYLKMPAMSQDAAVIRTYLDTVTDLPWNIKSKENNDIVNARNVLDKDHYGLEKVKDRIIENIAVRNLTDNVKGQIICLAGPPGTGKTSIGKSIAKALGKKYVRVSLGGVRDEADIRGHRKTYVGAMPGRIISAIMQAGTNNPLIMLDEIDKLSSDVRGDPSAALLEVLDSEQNNAFKDHYIEIPFDLSNVMFITTANNVSLIDPPLLDRMEVIELTSYTREEKFHIAKEHLVPKQIKKHGLKSANMKIADSSIYILIDYYTREAGVRGLEKQIAALCRKAAKEIVAGEKEKVSITSRNIESYLGHKKYIDETVSGHDEVGLANGLAWTSVGGVMLPIEAVVMDGKGTIETTGSLGDVMKESAKIAVSYVRGVYKKYNIPGDFYKTKDIHIHAPEGATPKDGPSAGVTMTTALISALSGIPVKSDVAMTGEITLHGKVLPIGGLREKTMAAYKEGMKTVIIPKGNEGDLDEVDNAVKENVDFILAEKLSDVLDNALVMPKKSKVSDTQKGKSVPLSVNAKGSGE